MEQIVNVQIKDILTNFRIGDISLIKVSKTREKAYNVNENTAIPGVVAQVLTKWLADVV